MDAIVTFLLYALLLVFISMVGASLPHVRRLSDKQIHLLIALSAGIFLGLLFFLLLPEALEECEGFYDTHVVMVAIILGFLLIMAVEMYLKQKRMESCPCKSCQDNHSHTITSLSSFVGLSIHAVCDGMALAATFLAGETVGLIATVGMCIHKFVVLFSLSSTMLLTDIDGNKSFLALLGFSLISPIAGILFFLLFSGMTLEGLIGLPLAFAAGTFMYVALCNMLPEAFHRKGQEMKSFALVILGVVIIAVISFLFPHVH